MAVTLAGVYDMIVDFGNIADPNIKWRNTMTFASNTTPVADVGIVLAIRDFFVRCIRSDSHMTGYNVYNWARGRQPYPTGSPIISTTGSLPGTADTNWGPMNTVYHPTGGEVCARMDHEPLTGGKPGRSFLRGLFGTLDIQSLTGGKWALVNSQANWQSALNGNVSASGLSAYIGAPTSGQIVAVVRYSAKLQVVHGYSGIQNFSFIGPTTNKQTRKNKR